jgi:BirA family biotin operon repressor/biotin-[acetyl-CoA-carboxylase] ligase
MIDVRRFQTVPSTMDVAARLAAEGARHGVVVSADEQTAGRGRRGAAWASPPGAGLYFSFVARPSSVSLPLVTLAAGVGICDGIRTATGLGAGVKWPNDLLVGRRKLAGILAEGLSIGTPAQAVVIGVGVNVLRASYPSDVAARATSIEEELGRAVDREALLADVLVTLERRLETLERDAGDILRAWRDASPTATGTRVAWDGKHGVTAGIDDGGALLVRTASGVERVIGGELHWTL